MNGTEQRNHRTVTATIAKNLEVVTRNAAHAIADVDRRLVLEGRALRQQINDERTHRLKLADEQRAYVDGEDAKTRRQITAVADGLAALRDRGFFGRLRWLLRGI